MKQVIVFDFDGTVIRGDSIFLMVCYALKRKKISLPGALYAGLCAILRKLHLMGDIPVKHAGHAFLEKMSDADRTAFLMDFANQLRLLFRPEAVQTIRDWQSKGDYVLLCSASGECYMQYVAGFLGVDALLCTPCDDKGQPLHPNCKREEKIRRVHAWMAEQGLSPDSWLHAYGDSAGDIAMMSKCKQPILVHPRSALLKAYPHAPVLQWREP